MTAFILIIFLLPMIGLIREASTMESIRDININMVVLIVYTIAWLNCFAKLMS